MKRIVNQAHASPDSANKLAWKVIADNEVATRGADGTIAAHFHDDVWPIDAYGVNGDVRSLRFKPESSRSQIEGTLEAHSRIQRKQILFFLMHLVNDDVPAPSTLSNYSTVLKNLSTFALLNGLTLYGALERVDIVLSFVRPAGMEKKAGRLHAIMAHLNRLGPTKTGLVVKLTKLRRPMMKRLAEAPPVQQHPVIPTRIYSHFLSCLETEIALLEVAADHLADRLQSALQRAPAPPTIQPPLQAILDHFDGGLSGPRLTGLYGEIQEVCETAILAYSGMRVQEATNLPFNCLRAFSQDGVEHFAIEGITTKLAGGRAKRACWITSSVGARAIKLMQRIFRSAHAHHANDEYKKSTDGTFMLFCATGLHPSRYRVGRSSRRSFGIGVHLRDRMFLPIEPRDLEEMDVIEVHMAWAEDPRFLPGQTWPFTKHQLRRSLALYAQRSGLVTLPSLKRQLQHVTTEMAMYYSRGSAFAKDLLAGNPDHFAKEWAEAQPLSQYLAYAAHILFSGEALFGGHATWVRSRSVIQSPVSVHSRTDTIEMFKKGQLAYKETVLGGCSSTAPCKISPLEWLPIECLTTNCKSLSVSPRKLERVIGAQERRVGALGSTEAGLSSIEYRMERDTLATLFNAQARLRSR